MNMLFYEPIILTALSRGLVLVSLLCTFMCSLAVIPENRSVSQQNQMNDLLFLYDFQQ